MEEAQQAGLLAPFPVLDIISATQALMHGLAHRVVEEAALRARGWLAIEALVTAVTEIIGLGLVPRR